MMKPTTMLRELLHEAEARFGKCNHQFSAFVAYTDRPRSSRAELRLPLDRALFSV